MRDKDLRLPESVFVKETGTSGSSGWLLDLLCWLTPFEMSVGRVTSGLSGRLFDLLCWVTAFEMLEGKLAVPTTKSERLPSRAVTAPETGSQGASLRSYSRVRFLLK